jgi:uncharacterized protein YcaQ
MTEPRLTQLEARRIALAAQGLDRRRPERSPGARPPGVGDIRKALARTGLLQLDYVTVVGHAHEHVLFSRIGPYDTARLDDIAYRRREFTEQWAREASLVPVAWWPLLGPRRAEFRVRPWGFEATFNQLADYVERVVDEIRERGPLAAEDLDVPEGVERRMPGTWMRSVPRAVLETLFARGRLAVAHRRADRSRAFDLPERIVPDVHHERVLSREDAHRELLRHCARGLGVGTAADIADYVRMPIGDARPRLAELAESGSLEVVHVDGWREPAYLDPSARRPKRVDGCALLSPFDPAIWYRPRLARLFDFDYRFEIFVPEEKRKWGCYVLPFLLGERLVARVDLKTERKDGCLRVRAAFLEDGAPRDEVAAELAAELRLLAGWLGLESVAVERRGNLATALRRATRG